MAEGNITVAEAVVGTGEEDITAVPAAGAALASPMASVGHFMASRP